MFDGLFEAGLVGFEEGLAPLLGEENALGAAAEVFGLQGSTVYEGEDDAVHDDGLEDLRNIQVQCVAALVGGVEIADPGVEVGAVDLGKDRYVHQAIAEGDESVDPVRWWSPGALLELEVLTFQDIVPRTVVKLPAPTLQRHKLLWRPRLLDQRPLQPDVRKRLVEVRVTAAIVLEHLLHVRQSSAHEGAGEDHALCGIHVVGGLCQRHVSRDVLFARHVRARPVPVVVIDVQGDVVAGQEVQELRIQVDLPEDVQLARRLHRHEPSPLGRSETQSILVPLQLAAVEYVDWLPGHDQQNSA